MRKIKGGKVMSIQESNDVEMTLQQPDVHQRWEGSYRNKENEEFYRQAFDYIVSVLPAEKKTTFLDIGCGIGCHSIRLAKHGFSVLAVDFSEHVLKTAELNLQDKGWKDNIKLQRENILSLSFADETFDYILCWGVLMHIPDIEKAVSELDRVVKKGGVLVISEGNMLSVESITLRGIKKILGREKATVKKTAAGIESWQVTSSGNLLTRQADIGWLKRTFKSKGFVIKKHVSGQFTELYTKFSNRAIRKVIFIFNMLWFKYVKLPYFAFGNIIIFEKQK